MAANIFTGATNSNWGTSTNWSLGAVPTATDANTATFDATSPNCTVNVTAVCNNIDFTGYTNTITMTNGITVSGNVTFVSTMASRVAGSGLLTINTASTITTNGATWPNDLIFTAATSTIFTITGTLTISGIMYPNAGPGNTQLNNGEVICNGGISWSLGSSTLAGTSPITLSGGTLNAGAFGFITSDNFRFNGNCTVTGTLQFNLGIMTHLSGEVDWTNSTVNTAGGARFNLGTMPTALNNLTLSGAAPTTTLQSNLYVNGTVTLSASGTTIWTGNTLYIGGNLTHSTNSTQTGTTTFVMNGTGTYSAASINCIIRNNFTINTTGKITFGAIIAYNTGTFTYLSGKVVVPKNAIMYVAATTTLINCHKINFETVQITAGTTTTMNEFFSGSPNKPVKVISSALANYNIAFQNGYEKIAKYVKVSNLTLTNTAASRGSLLILNNKGKYFRGSNNIGNIRYTNTTPNGIAKGDPTVPNQMTAPIGGYLSDPMFN